MKSYDKISIVLPCYKAERCIANMIRDIQAQTYTNWELIVVSNGGGGQESQLKIIREFEKHDRRIHCYSIDEVGPGPARNFGIEKATGTWIAFVDADDDVKSDWLSRYLPMMANNPDIICAGYTNNFWMQKELQHSSVGCDAALYNAKLTEPKIFISAFLKQEHIAAPPWNKLFRAKFINENQLRFRHYQVYEDYIFNFEAIVSCESLCFIPDCGYQYNVSFDAGTMARYSSTHMQAGIDRIDAWCAAMIASGIGEKDVDTKRTTMSAHYSMEELLNTFRLNSPHTFASRIRIVKDQFSKSWMKQVGELYKQCPPTFLESLFYKFYRLNAPTMCVLTFSAMHWVRRNMKGVSAILLRHIG